MKKFMVQGQDGSVDIQFSLESFHVDPEAANSVSKRKEEKTDKKMLNFLLGEDDLINTRGSKSKRIQTQ